MFRRFVQLFPLALVFIAAACEAPLDPVAAATEMVEASVSTPLKSFTMTVGESRVLPVESINAAGSEISYDFAAEGESISAGIQLGNLVVEALSAGDAILSLSNTTGAEYQVNISVLEEGIYDSGELYLRYMTSFTYPWDSSDLGGSVDMRVCDPILPAGWYSLGSTVVVQSLSEGLPADTWVMAVRDRQEGNALAFPESYEKSYQYSDFCVWVPIAPVGYAALGVLVRNTGTGTPALDEVVCVREDLTRPASLNPAVFWNDAGASGMPWVNFRWIEEPTDAEPDPGHFYLESSLFLANSDYSSPNKLAPMNVLHLPVRVAEEYNDDEVPHLESYDNPGPRTASYFGRSILLPFHMVRDGAFNVPWKLANSPFYRLRRQDYYRNICFYDNRDGSLQETAQYTITRGIGAAKSATYSSETSLSLTASYGVNTGVSESNYSITLTQSFGYSSTASTNWSQQTSVSNSMNVPPRKSAVLWDKTTGFTVDRWYNNAWQPLSYIHDGQSYDDFAIGMSSVRKSEYPRDW